MLVNQCNAADGSVTTVVTYEEVSVSADKAREILKANGIRGGVNSRGEVYTVRTGGYPGSERLIVADMENRLRVAFREYSV